MTSLCPCYNTSLLRLRGCWQLAQRTPVPWVIPVIRSNSTTRWPLVVMTNGVFRRLQAPYILACSSPCVGGRCSALGFQNGDGYRLSIDADLYAQGVIGSALPRGLLSMISIAPAVSSRLIKSSVHPRWCNAGSSAGRRRQ